MNSSFLPIQYTLLFSLHIVEVFPPPHLETLFLYLELLFSPSSTHLVAPQNAMFSLDFIQQESHKGLGQNFLLRLTGNLYQEF